MTKSPFVVVNRARKTAGACSDAFCGTGGTEGRATGVGASFGAWACGAAGAGFSAAVMVSPDWEAQPMPAETAAKAKTAMRGNLFMDEVYPECLPSVNGPNAFPGNANIGCMEEDRKDRLKDAGRTLVIQLLLTGVLWVLAPRWWHLRDLLGGLAVLIQGLQFSMHLWVRSWVLAHEEPGPDLHADYTPKEWFPRPGSDGGGDAYSKSWLLFKGAKLAAGFCEGALFLLVLARLVPGVSDSMERLFSNPPR